MDGKWKTMEQFRELVQFNATNLDVHTQRLQEKKMHHALTHLLDSITKHFDPWVNRHLPLAIFTEQPLARAVASFFANEQYQGPDYYNSPIQGTTKNVRRFCLFLNK